MVELLETEYPVFYKPYIDILDDRSGLTELLEFSLELFESTLYDLDEMKQDFRYSEGKWTVKEVVQHMIDTERVFVYRALRFSRKDNTSLPGFEQNSYVENCNCTARKYHILLDEFCLLRRATILMFKEFDQSVLDLRGPVGGQLVSVRALGFICSGHVLHHLEVLKQRYL